MGLKHNAEFWKATPRMIVAMCEIYTGTSADAQERKMIEMFGGEVED